MEVGRMIWEGGRELPSLLQQLAAMIVARAMMMPLDWGGISEGKGAGSNCGKDRKKMEEVVEGWPS